MALTSTDQQFLEVFKHCLKIEAKTVSIKTLLSERNLRRINYTPYYQRNYVWDIVKQTFFIESVILGTEIPPLIFFKSGMLIEVIDGRQRFETLKKFKENDIKLNNKGLMSLEFLSKKTFNTLEPENLKDIFWNSNIRIFEFEIVNLPNISPEIEDRIKKEIFRRYNTGITPLTSVEVDNAKYNEDKLSDLFKNELRENRIFANQVNDCFYNKDESTFNVDHMANYLRRLFILNNFPISRYAGSSERIETLDLLYEFAVQNIEDYNYEFEIVKKQIEKVHKFYLYMTDGEPRLKNKLIYECLFWGIRILEAENIEVLDNLKIPIKRFYLRNLIVYGIEESHYYGNIVARFENTAIMFEQIFEWFRFNIYLKNPNFIHEVKNKILEQKDSAVKIDQFEHLRINKPSPISTPVDEIRNDVKTSRYLLRPSYQRKEKISELKASAIIESIILGINLPPLFIFKREDGTKEVIDGQQRLLSIIGFLGETYTNEEGKQAFSKNNAFKLRGLKILTELNGKRYLELSEEETEKILDFTTDIIIIEEKINTHFEPTDLFIRLNNKPYPIQQNSFEMWNSTVDSEIIKEIKKTTKKHANWFYIKESNEIEEKRTDRMENEELVTILSYIVYNSKKTSFDKIIGFFKSHERVTCRLVYKAGLTEFLEKLEKEVTEKNAFIRSIKETDELIEKFNLLFDFQKDKEKVNTFLNVRSNKTFRRSLQDFYIIWLMLVSYESIDMNNPPDLIVEDITDMLALFRNVNNDNIDETFVPKYIKKLQYFYNS